MSSIRFMVATVMTILLLGIFLASILSSCALPIFDKPPSADDSPSNTQYRIIAIAGMPCLTLNNHLSGGYSVVSITCDWSKYNGQK